VPSDWSISELRGQAISNHNRPPLLQNAKHSFHTIVYTTFASHRRTCLEPPLSPEGSLQYSPSGRASSRSCEAGFLTPLNSSTKESPQPSGRSHPPSPHKTPSRWSSKFFFTPLSYCDPALASTIRMDEMSTRIPRGLNSTFKMSFTKVLSPADSFTVEEVRLYSTSSSRYGNSHG